jgi:hypothetical protein
MELNFRPLKPDEIECKATIVGNFIEVSLHTKASTCTKLLNETVGAMDWEKEYTNGNKNCIVRIWDKDKSRFVSKEDCGGSLTEIDGYKGQASNGFKRVCALGWGLGIEVYSQPKILLHKNDNNITYDAKGNAAVSEQYDVRTIEYNDDKEKKITHCVIVNSKGIVVYDGPNENGESNVVNEDEDEVLIIPEDADVINNEEFDESDTVLPDNTDGYEDILEDCATQPTPFGNVNYKNEFETEITRTKARKTDVLRVLGIDSFENVESVSEELLDETLRKLKNMPTRSK